MFYRKGMFAAVLTKGFDTRFLSADDRAAMTSVILDTDANARTALDIPTVYESSKDTQLLYLDQLIADFEAGIAAGHAEGWWQTYFSENILYFQPSYIRKIGRMNIKVTGTQFPDFAVVTSDGYLDILEIKRPDTHCS